MLLANTSRKQLLPQILSSLPSCDMPRYRRVTANERMVWVKNQKTDRLHKLTTQLVRSYDVICVRDEKLVRIVKQQPQCSLKQESRTGMPSTVFC